MNMSEDSEAKESARSCPCTCGFQKEGPSSQPTSSAHQGGGEEGARRTGSSPARPPHLPRGEERTAGGGRGKRSFFSDRRGRPATPSSPASPGRRRRAGHHRSGGNAPPRVYTVNRPDVEEAAGRGKASGGYVVPLLMIAGAVLMGQRSAGDGRSALDRVFGTRRGGPRPDRRNYLFQVPRGSGNKNGEESGQDDDVVDRQGLGGGGGGGGGAISVRQALFAMPVILLCSPTQFFSLQYPTLRNV